MCLKLRFKLKRRLLKFGADRHERFVAITRSRLTFIAQVERSNSERKAKKVLSWVLGIAFLVRIKHREFNKGVAFIQNRFHIRHSIIEAKKEILQNSWFKLLG